MPTSPLLSPEVWRAPVPLVAVALSCSTATVAHAQDDVWLARGDALLRARTSVDEALASDACFGMYVARTLVGWRRVRVVAAKDHYLAASETWCRYTIQGRGETVIRARVDVAVDASLSLLALQESRQGTAYGQPVDETRTVTREGDAYVVRATMSGVGTEARLEPPQVQTPLLLSGFEWYFPRVLADLPVAELVAFRVLGGGVTSIAGAALGDRHAPPVPPRARGRRRVTNRRGPVSARLLRAR